MVVGRSRVRNNDRSDLPYRSKYGRGSNKPEGGRRENGQLHQALRIRTFSPLQGKILNYSFIHLFIYLTNITGGESSSAENVYMPYN